MPKFFPDIEQGSEEWHRERMGRATASNFARIVTEVKGEWSETGAKKYAREVAVQRLLDEETEPRIGHLARIERGKLMEPDAIEAYERQVGYKTAKMGIVISDDGTRSCSPDRIYTAPGVNGGEDLLIGIETKCPGGPTHLDYLENSGPGRAYIWQVVGSLLITGFHAWDFWSYHPGLDGVLVRYWRKDYQDKIDAIAKHLDRFEGEVRAYMALMQRNGYEPPMSKMKTRNRTEWEKLMKADPNGWAIG